MIIKLSEGKKNMTSDHGTHHGNSINLKHISNNFHILRMYLNINVVLCVIDIFTELEMMYNLCEHTEEYWSKIKEEKAQDKLECTNSFQLIVNKVTKEVQDI